ncbi:UvrD-helicase domain-containing protein [Candidatus Shapirobacteria bacterium]|nr:UvrD-helicase domain-containing protein [Candidatus Shapirobacteria bacterium]
MNNLLEGLNPAQKQVVVYDGGPLLVLAGAGSGKTRVLTHRAAWLVASGKARADELLLLTFTNKAAGEMKERLLGLLKPTPEESKPTSGVLTRGLFAGTFHSFCAYVLRRNGKAINLLPNFVIFDEGDSRTLIKGILKKLDLSDQRFKPAAVKAIIEQAKNDLVDAESFSKKVYDPFRKVVARIYLEYERSLKAMNALDFSDLLFGAVKLFAEKESILAKYQEKYKYILVDEYQDTNHSQYLLTKLLAQKDRNLTVTGDVAQAIYSWRGADYRNLLNLKADFPKIKTINLEVNYRSTQKILDVAYEVIKKNTKHPILKLVTEKKEGDKVVAYQALSEGGEAGWVADKIKTLIDFKGVDPTKIAILYRTNAQSRVIEEVLIRRGLPYVLIGGVRFYERAEVKDVLSLLRVFYNSKDEISRERLEKNMGKRRTAKAREFIKNQEGKKWKSKPLLEAMLEASSYLEKYDRDDEEDRKRLENINELLSVAQGFPDLGEFLENVSLVQQEYFAQEKEKKNWVNEAIRLMTLHASKGLEFEVVFIVGLEEGLLPHTRSLEEEERLEEERRLCYVGMTRAKTNLFLTYASQRLFFGKTSLNEPSRFLLDVSEKLLDFEEADALDEGWDLPDEW